MEDEFVDKMARLLISLWKKNSKRAIRNSFEEVFGIAPFCRIEARAIELLDKAPKGE